MGNVHIFKCVNCLNLHCFALTNTHAQIVNIKFSSFHLDIFSCHILWLSLCSLVLRFLRVNDFLFIQLRCEAIFAGRHYFLREKFLAPF